MLKGIDITLYEKTQSGTDEADAPVYTETLAIPKGDAHDWNDVQVAFFGQHFRTCGGVVQGIERMIPLCWNKKVQVVRDE